MLRLARTAVADIAGYGVTDIAAVESSQNAKSINIQTNPELIESAHIHPTQHHESQAHDQLCLTSLPNRLIPLVSPLAGFG